MDVDAPPASSAARQAEIPEAAAEPPPADADGQAVPPAAKHELTDAAIIETMKDVEEEMGEDYSQQKLEKVSFQDALTWATGNLEQRPKLLEDDRHKSVAGQVASLMNLPLYRRVNDSRRCIHRSCSTAWAGGRA